MVVERLVIAGGGIGGLTFASAARRIGVKSIIVVERAQDVCRANIGSGLGLWPNSQAALDLIGAKARLISEGAWMPIPSYRDPSGNPLARATSDFGKKIPVLCIHRDRLQRALVDSCVETSSCTLPPVRIMSGTSVVSHQVDAAGHVLVRLSDNTDLVCDMLVGADGIHSEIRTQMLKEFSHISPNSGTPVACGYTYFRATTHIDGALAAAAGTRGWHDTAFESWGQGMRFGYVPLKAPEVFWFCSVPIGPGTDLAPLRGAHVSDEASKRFLLSLVGNWKPAPELPVATLRALIEHTTTEAILRTDIYKVGGVERFPWSAHNARVVLLGDSAHATAPNLAQGAGLCIEDAVTLADAIHRYNTAADGASPHGPRGAPAVRRDLSSFIDEYETSRKIRAITVQSMSDMVASVGQLKPLPLRIARDSTMRLGTALFPGLQTRIFERVVSYTLGGSGAQLTWLPPILDVADSEAKDRATVARCLLGRVLGQDTFSALPSHVRVFRSSPRGGDGDGMVTVERQGGIAGILGMLAGLPQSMTSAPFRAAVVTAENGSQRWTRTFGAGTIAQAVYSTTHDTVVDGGKHRLTESVGGLFDGLLGFVYTVTARKTDLLYESCGMVFCGILLPLPAFLQPRSRWVEVPTATGWTFDGTIAFPFVGDVMHYHGNFAPTNIVPAVPAAVPVGLGPAIVNRVPKPRAIVLGGSGLLGCAVCQELKHAGWEVIVLSRSVAPSLPANVDSVVRWDGKTSAGWADLLTPGCTIVNISGENPGTRRWNKATKAAILSSRLDSIAAIADAIRKAGPNAAPGALLQASAAGIYGNRHGEKLTEDSEIPADDSGRTAGDRFRIETCLAIEAAAARAVMGTTTKLSLLRIGHLLAVGKGLLPHMQTAALLGASRLGSGRQYVPWCHIIDAGRAVAAIAAGATSPLSPEFTGVVNICSPYPVTNQEFMHALAVSRGYRHCLVPVPGFALRLSLGDSASVVLDGHRMFPARLVQAGFEFSYPHLPAALLSLEKAAH